MSARSLRALGQPLYVMKRDIADFFDSIHHEVLLDKLAQHVPVAAEQPLRLWRGREDRGEDLEHVGLHRRQRDAGARERRGRRGELGERDGPEAPRRLADAGGIAVHADRRRADVKDLHGIAERDVDGL